MRRKTPVEFALAAGPACVLLGDLAVFMFLGAFPALGFLVGAILSFGSLFIGKWIVARTIGRPAKRVMTHFSLQLLMLLKLPLFLVVVLWINSLGRTPVGCFLVGYGLVYLLLLTGAIFRSAPATYDEDS